MLPRLKVADRNPHLLSTEDGKPFFMVGDTAWELLHRLNREEVIHYLDTRQRQKFNMVWTVVLSEFNNLSTPTQLGDLPFLSLETLDPNPKYFDWVAWVIDQAAERGIYVGVVVSWGDKLTAPWGTGPRIFDTPEKGKQFASFVANRFKDKTNIMWVLGGDRPPFVQKGQWAEGYAASVGLDPDKNWLPIWDAMAEGIFEQYGENALITYHPQGGPDSTSYYLSDRKWLHLNAMQSGHGAGRDTPVWERIERDYNLEPIRPTFDAEPNYEDHPVSPWPSFNPQNGYFDEYDVRRQNWRSTFAGGCGFIYGHHSMWGCASDRYPWINHTKMDWKQAVDRPGAEQMKFIRELMETEDFFDWIPDQSIILGENGKHAEHKRAIRTKDGTKAMIYLPHGGSVQVKTEGDAVWFDPRTGKRSPAAAEDGNYKAPNDIDWVLIIG